MPRAANQGAGEPAHATTLDALFPPDARMINRLALRHEDRGPPGAACPVQCRDDLGPEVSTGRDGVGAIAVERPAHRALAGRAPERFESDVREERDPLE